MKLLVIILFFISCGVFAADKIPDLNYQINTVENLGIKLAVPVIYDGFIFARSCGEKCVFIIDKLSFKMIKSIDLHLKPFIHEISENVKIIELNDHVVLLLNEKSQELLIIYGGKHQNSPRLVPSNIELDSYNFIYTYEQGSLFVEIANLKTNASIAKTLISQISYLNKMSLGGIDYSICKGIICAKNLDGQVFEIKTGPKPSMPVMINEKLLACSNWSNQTVSIIDHSSYKVIKQIPVGRYPLKPVVLANKLYVSNFGDGSISIIELLAE